MTRKAMLIDTSKCTACRGCQVICKQWWDLQGTKTENNGSYENPKDLSVNTWTRIRFIESEAEDRFRWLFFKQGCMHCAEPACVNVCPTGALKKLEEGQVALDRNLCNGCGYCRTFCPFDIPRLGEYRTVANHDINEIAQGDSGMSIFKGALRTSKCNFCQDRTTNGLLPSCVKTCPTGALQWGEWDQMLEKAKKKVEYLKKNGDPNATIYGDKLLGGLGRLYVLRDKPEVYGLEVNPTYPVMANAWQDWVQPLGYAAFGLAVVGLAGVSVVGAIRGHVNDRKEEEAEDVKIKEEVK